MKFSTHRNWEVNWAFFLGILGLAIFMVIRAGRYSKIRKLFEDAGPQSLADLKSHTPFGH
jgi:hypothetical protein